MSDKLQEIYNDIPQWKLWWWDIRFYFELWIANITDGWYQHYIDLFWLHYYGFYPKAIVESYYFETAFLFDDKVKAERAFQKCERENSRAIGWYYEVEEFKNLIDEDENYNWNDLEIWWVYE